MSISSMHAAVEIVSIDSIDMLLFKLYLLLGLLALSRHPSMRFLSVQSSGPSGAEEDDPGQPAVQIEALRQRSLENDLRRKALLANKGDER